MKIYTLLKQNLEKKKLFRLKMAAKTVFFLFLFLFCFVFFFVTDPLRILIYAI